MLALFTLLTGLLYPLIVIGITQLVFPFQANGSLIVQGGQVGGSELIGQEFDNPGYFWGRPSATSPVSYNATASSGSNLGPNNPNLEAAVKGRITALRAADPTNNAPVPVDLVTASASGLDPHISPAAAIFQVSRIAHFRGVSEVALLELIEQSTEGRQLGFLGEPHVNVLLLNLKLDEIK